MPEMSIYIDNESLGKVTMSKYLGVFIVCIL